MKKRLAIAAALALWTFNASALDVVSYRSFKESIRTNDEVKAPLAKLALNAYFQAISEVLTVQRSSKNNPILIREDVSFCPPQTVQITPDLVEAAANQEVTVNASTYSDDPKWDKATVSIYAMVGLARMFPCNKGS